MEPRRVGHSHKDKTYGQEMESKRQKRQKGKVSRTNLWARDGVKKAKKAKRQSEWGKLMGKRWSQKGKKANGVGQTSWS